MMAAKGEVRWYSKKSKGVYTPKPNLGNTLYEACHYNALEHITNISHFEHTCNALYVVMVMVNSDFAYNYYYTAL